MTHSNQTTTSFTNSQAATKGSPLETKAQSKSDNFQTPKHFELGQTVITCGATDLFAGSGYLLAQFLTRHQQGDWGEVCEEDKQSNNEATHFNERIISIYKFEDKTFWIITEHDRTVTTILLPSEY